MAPQAVPLTSESWAVNSKVEVPKRIINTTVFTCLSFNLRLNMRFPKQMLPAIINSGTLNCDVRKFILVTELQRLVSTVQSQPVQSQAALICSYFSLTLYLSTNDF